MSPFKCLFILLIKRVCVRARTHVKNRDRHYYPKQGKEEDARLELDAFTSLLYQ